MDGWATLSYSKNQLYFNKTLKNEKKIYENERDNKRSKQISSCGLGLLNEASIKGWSYFHNFLIILLRDIC